MLNRSNLVAAGWSGWFIATATLSNTHEARQPTPDAVLIRKLLDCRPRATPLRELSSLSQLTGCKILAKMENKHDAGSVKDRAAWEMLHEAALQGRLHSGYTLVEGTGGNTGVALAYFAQKIGCSCLLTMPQLVSQEKLRAMRACGAEALVQPAVPFDDPRHYYQLARRLGASSPQSLWLNQFENLANFRAHYFTTGPEILQQTNGHLHAFICAAGTGGTIAGCSQFLVERIPGLQVFLADPEGSSLANFVRTKKLQASAGSTVIEGIGIGRLTTNFCHAIINEAVEVSDEEAYAMQRFLRDVERIDVGPSAALNVAATVKVAARLGPGHVLVTIICDGADRYESKLRSEQWLVGNGLQLPVDIARAICEWWNQQCSVWTRGCKEANG